MDRLIIRFPSETVIVNNPFEPQRMVHLAIRLLKVLQRRIDKKRKKQDWEMN